MDIEGKFDSPNLDEYDDANNGIKADTHQAGRILAEKLARDFDVQVKDVPALAANRTLSILESAIDIAITGVRNVVGEFTIEDAFEAFLAAASDRSALCTARKNEISSGLN